MVPDAGRSHDVRHHESDEADEARRGDGRGSDQRGHDETRSHRPVDVDAEAGGRILAERENVDLPSEENNAHPPTATSDEQNHDLHPRRIATDPIIHHSALRTVLDSAFAIMTMIAALANAPTTTPAMSKTRGSPRDRPRGDEEGSDDSDDRTDERGDRNERRAEAERRAEHGTNCRSAGDAKEIRLGERIPHCSLQRRARHSEARANENRQRDARYAQRAYDHGRHAIANVAKRIRQCR